MKPSEVFREAKCLLFERGWTQRAYQAPDGSMCIRHALYLAQGDTAPSEIKLLRDDVEGPLAVALGLPPASFGGLSFNDAPGRTFSEVIDALDKAEKIAELAEANDA